MVKVDQHNKDANKPKDSERDLFITCFVDASYCPQTGAWGFCCWIKYGKTDKPEIIVKGGKEVSHSTNIEIKALRFVVHYLEQNYAIKDKVIVIQSDCISALEGLHVDDLYRLGAKFIKKKHVRAHTGHKTNRSKVNRLVDSRARKEMRRQRGLFERTIKQTTEEIIK